MPELNIPPVPNFLHWFLVFATVSMMVAWIWRKYLSDRWAGFSQKSRRKRLIRIAENFNRVCDLREDIPAIVAVSTRVLIFFTYCTLFMVIFGVEVIIIHLGGDEISFLHSIFARSYLFISGIGAIYTLLIGSLILADVILPLTRFEEYRETTHGRLVRLLVKTDFPTGGLVRLPTDLPTDKLVKWLLFEVKKTPPVETQQK